MNTTSDALAPGLGLLSLREAIGFVNVDPPGNSTITFSPTVFATAQTINMIGFQFELNSKSQTETITGPAAGLTLNANGASRVFQVDSGVTAALSGLTITNGSTTTDGGGVDNNGGTLTLTGCTISGSSAKYGGGLANINGGTATLTNCTRQRQHGLRGRRRRV